jgi:glycosyltransferase involved in cell wall biosynthesis
MRVLLADVTDVRLNPRPRRHIEYLVQAGHEVDVLSMTPDGSEFGGKVRYIQIPKSRKLFSRPWWIRFISSKILPSGHRLGEASKSYRRAMFGNFDIEHYEYGVCLVENLYLLPGIVTFSSIKKVIFDLREYHPSQEEQSLPWVLFRKPEVLRIYKNVLPLVDGVITVSKGIQDCLMSEWGVYSRVSLSAPNQKPISPASLPAKPIRIVHHGLAARKRGLDFVIDAIGGMNSVTLTFFLVGEKKDIEYLVNRASQFKNIFFREAVHPTKIVESMSKFDLGLAFFPLKNLNLVHSMPNKFFEYITAGIPTIVAAGTDMANFVEDTSFGFVTTHSSVASLRLFIESISPEKVMNQRMFVSMAQRRISPEVQKRVLLSMINDVSS